MDRHRRLSENRGSGGLWLWLRSRKQSGAHDLLKQEAAAEKWSMFDEFWKLVWEEQAQGVSEYAVLLVLLVLIVVATVHALGTNAQQVIDKVNTALHS